MRDPAGREIRGYKVVSPAELGVAIHRGVRAFPFPTRVRVEDERRLEDRLDHVADGMVNHPVAERRFGDQTRLRVVNPEGSIPFRSPCFALEFAVQSQGVSAEVGKELRHVRPGAFAPGGPKRRR